MRVTTILDKDTWKNFIDENPQGNIFQTPEMYEVFSRTKGCYPTLMATIGDDDDILALLLSVQISLYDGPLKFFTTRAVSHGGVLTTGNLNGQVALSLLLKNYNQRVSSWPIFTELRNHSDLSRIQDVFRQNGFTYEDHLNYLIDLQRKPEEILKSFHDDAQRRIRKSLKGGKIMVKDVTDRFQLPTIYRLFQESYRYARIPLADISLFEAAFDVLLPKKMARFILLYVDGVPVTASVSLLYKDVIYGWYTGTDREYRKYGPNEFEIWELINWGIDHGYRVFDFGGAGKPNEKYGVRDFKAKFNGHLVNYGRNTSIHAPVRMKFGKVAYEVARNPMHSLKNMFIKSNSKPESEK